MRWENLVDQQTGGGCERETSSDDLRLFQLYLCRILTFPYLMMLLDQETTVMLAKRIGVPKHDWPDKNGSDDEEEPTQELELWLRNAAKKRAAELRDAMSGDAQLSFEPLIGFLQARLQLTPTETKVVTFLILKTLFKWSVKFLEELSLKGKALFFKALSIAFSENVTEVVNALEEGSKLRLAGLISDGYSYGRQTLNEFISPGDLLNKLLLSPTNLISESKIEALVFAHVCPMAPQGDHDIRSFSGLTDLQLLLGYLKKAVRGHERGKNVLLFGPPGTGKTQLAYSLADHLGIRMSEVPTGDENGNAITGQKRLASARLAQRLLHENSDALLLFDEMEDAFRKSEQYAKGWFNQLLENNTIPTVWISNDIHRVDPALLRRFDLILEVDGPKTSGTVNESISIQLDQLPATKQWVEALKTQSWMTPALAENLSEIGSLLPAGQIIRNQEKLESIVSKRLSVLQKEPVSLSILPEEWQPDFPEFRSDWLSTSPDIRSVERGLRAIESARLCLFGPPGAGKTAYAGELARRLGRPFELVSGSDLMSCMVGETEQNIAAMFGRAEAAGAVLLLDEADTFLFSRETARQSWEVSMTNEFMVRMERFKGVFLATTNRFDALDNAVLRRFDVKVRFGYLDSQQLKGLLEACVDDPKNVAKLPDSALSEFHALTPGVVRAGVRRLKLMGLRPKLSRLLEVLADEQELQLGGTQSNPIGFF